MSRARLYSGPRPAAFEVRLTDTGSCSLTGTITSARSEAEYWAHEGRPTRTIVHEGCVHPGCCYGIVTKPGRGGSWVTSNCPQCAVNPCPSAFDL